MPMFVSDTLARGTTTARLIPGRGTMLSSRKRMLRASESMPGGTLPTSQRVPSPPNVDNTIGLGVGTCYTLFMATTIVERFWLVGLFAKKSGDDRSGPPNWWIVLKDDSDLCAAPTKGWREVNRTGVAD